jgi:hypothetical protein
MAFPDTTHTEDPQWPKAKHIGSAHVVDVRSDPAAEVEFEEVVACFMVASYEDRQVGCCADAGVVFVEVAHVTVLEWDVDTVEIVDVSNRLEVTANDEQIDTSPAADIRTRELADILDVFGNLDCSHTPSPYEHTRPTRRCRSTCRDRSLRWRRGRLAALIVRALLTFWTQYR